MNKQRLLHAPLVVIRQRGTSRMRAYLLILVLLSVFLIALSLLGQSPNQPPAIAYSNHGVLYLVTEEGQVLRSVETRVPIGEFAVSGDVEWVVFTPPREPKVSGGPLWILNLSTKKLEKIPLDPYYNRFITGDRTEFNADPEFSPDGSQIAFAAHAEATGDTFNTRGPLEILDLQKRDIRILKDTLDGQLWPLDSLYGLHWSADGRRILYNYAGGSSITDSDGAKEGQLGVPQFEFDSSIYGMYSIGWLGSQCVFYQVGKDPDHDPARVLSLKTGKTSTAADLLQLPEQKLRGLVAFSLGLWIHADGSQYRVEDGGGSWLVPGDTKTTHVQLLRSSDKERIPPDCK